MRNSTFLSFLQYMYNYPTKNGSVPGIVPGATKTLGKRLSNCATFPLKNVRGSLGYIDNLWNRMLMLVISYLAGVVWFKGSKYNMHFVFEVLSLNACENAWCWILMMWNSFIDGHECYFILQHIKGTRLVRKTWCDSAWRFISLIIVIANI